MTMDMIAAYRKYWQRHPPVDLLAAAYLGYKPPSPAAPPPPPLPDIEE